MASVAKKIGTGIFLSFSFFSGICLYVLHHQIVDFSVLEQYNPGKGSVLLDDQGKEWARFSYEQRKYVTLDEMAPMVQHAFIATEDHQFFAHKGLSIKGIVRSVVVNLLKGRRAQGASTITQQLVRLLFLDAKKSFVRKIKEQLYSLLVELQFTKQQILEIYLNHVYFGHGVYGVQAAARYFWSKDVAELTVDQAAVLAGMVKAPNHYSPIVSPEHALERRNTVISLLCKRGYITSEEKKLYQEKPLSVHHISTDCMAPHVKESLRISLEQMFGKKMLYEGGLVVQTTLNKAIQEQAARSFKVKLTEVKATMESSLDGGFVAIAPKTGEIKALVGGYDFTASVYNRAMQAKRQMGSTFKPLVYVQALLQGREFSEVEIDEYLEVVQGNKVWAPRNNTRTFYGPMTLAQALITSNNIISVKTTLQAGPATIGKLAHACHLVEEKVAYPSLALGCIDTTLVQAVALYALLANQGIYSAPHLIRWVKNEHGVKIYKPILQSEHILPYPVVSKVVKVLTYTVKRLEDFFHDYLPVVTFGKTGTTNDARTCWFCGGTQDLVAGVYIGKDNNEPMQGRVYSSKTAFPIWFDFYKHISHDSSDFDYDSSLTSLCIDPITGKTKDNCNQSSALTILV